jgi:CBS domain-containing protein
MSFSQILSTDTVGQVVAKQREGNGLVFAVKGEELGAVAIRMAKKRLSAVPIFETESRDKCMGLVDFADIVSALLSKFERDVEMMKNKDNFWQSLSLIKVETAIDASGKDPSCEISLDAPLKVATQLFARLGVKRLLVVDTQKKVVGLLSPSALTSHAVARLRGIMDPVLNQTVEQVSMGNSPVISVTKTRPLLEALVLMRESKHSCVAVIDDVTHVLAGSVSMSDIKMLFGTEDFSILTMACWDFIVLSRSLLDSEQFPFFGVGPESKVLSVIAKLLATHVHHIYVVDTHQRPKKVIGFSDVCKALVTGG